MGFRADLDATVYAIDEDYAPDGEAAEPPEYDDSEEIEADDDAEG